MQPQSEVCRNYYHKAVETKYLDCRTLSPFCQRSPTLYQATIPEFAEFANMPQHYSYSKSHVFSLLGSFHARASGTVLEYATLPENPRGAEP